MTLNLTVPVQMHTDFTPRITVIGVGGGGTNAVDNMIGLGLQGVDFVVANTDAQQLVHSKADRRVQLGPHLTQGLGAGAKPEIGRAAAQEAADELMRHLEGTHMVFITAGMGGGTGTGAAPVIAQLARESGVLTVGVVTKPFSFEGARRAKAAEQGIAELQQYVDTLIVIPNQNLFRLANERTGWREAFKMADNVLYMGVRGVTDLMMSPGQINLDFADIRTVMAEMGKAMMGTGEAEGENRAIRAAEAAISNPLQEDTSMAGARGLLINITGGEDLTLFEVDQAANRIKEEVSPDANIIFGSAIDENLTGRIRVSVVATGIDMGAQQQEAQRLRVVGGGGLQATVVQVPNGVPSGASVGTSAGAPNGTPSVTSSPSAGQPGHGFQPHVVQPSAASTHLLTPRMEAHAPAEASMQTPLQEVAPTRYAPPPPAQRPTVLQRTSAIFSEPPTAAPAQAPRLAVSAATTSPTRSLFNLVTRNMRGRAAATETPAEPQRAEPSFQASPAQFATQVQQTSEEALAIPAFLRRQSSGEVS